MKNIPALLTNAYLIWNNPISVVHFITMRCNARCKHCFINFDDPKTFLADLTLDEIQEMSKHMGNSLINVNLTGGEPLLRKDIFEIAKAYFKNAGIQSLYVTTNGMFTEWTKEFIDKFISSGIKGKLIFAISIDNFEEDHNRNRNVENLFKNAMATYKMIQSYNKNNIIADIALTVTHHNYDKVIELYNHLKKEYCVNAFTVTAMREEGIIKKLDPEIKEKIYNAYKNLTKIIRQDLIDKKITGFKNTLQGRIMNSKNFITFDILEKIYKRPQYVSRCPASALFGVIYANGDVYPCEILDNKKIGNVRDYKLNFMDLWNSDVNKATRQFIKKTKCNCSYECAWSLNIISDIRYIPKLLLGVIRSYLR